MKKQIDISGIIRLALTLSVFAAAACVMLAFVYTGTSKIIADRQRSDLNLSLTEVFPGADTFTQVSGVKSSDASVAILSQYTAIKDGGTAGLVLELSRAGYSGPIRLLVGVSADGFVTGVKILGHSETPGLGANAESPHYFVDKARKITFYGQFAGKSIQDPFEVKNDVIAISASTITSRAITEAVKAAALSAHAWLNNETVDVVSGASEGGDW
ncbi:MAG: RnfABCDGE type electron transport complex subunit G [Treponema sp.]|nr:RnfABCDGE type electron transport complex subunit G [Treponema sp.]